MMGFLRMPFRNAIPLELEPTFKYRSFAILKTLTMNLNIGLVEENTV